MRSVSGSYGNFVSEVVRENACIYRVEGVSISMC